MARWWLSSNPSERAVDRPLEVAEQAHRILIHKRKELHQQDRTERTLRIDPKKGVEEARPRQASRRAPSGVRGGVDQEAESPFPGEPRLYVHVARVIRTVALHFA